MAKARKSEFISLTGNPLGDQVLNAAKIPYGMLRITEAEDTTVASMDQLSSLLRHGVEAGFFNGDDARGLEAAARKAGLCSDAKELYGKLAKAGAGFSDVSMDGLSYGSCTACGDKTPHGYLVHNNKDGRSERFGGAVVALATGMSRLRGLVQENEIDARQALVLFGEMAQQGLSVTVEAAAEAQRAAMGPEERAAVEEFERDLFATLAPLLERITGGRVTIRGVGAVRKEK